MKKRLLTTLLIFCMVLTMMPVGVFADSTDITVGDITYRCTTDGSDNIATVKKCNTTASGNIIIPSEVEHGGKTYTVTGIGVGAFQGVRGLNKHNNS